MQHRTPDPHAEPDRAAPPPAAADVTGLLRAWSAGDATALDALVPIVYEELRRQAERALRHEAAGHTLQATALVHEAYLRLVDQRPAVWEGRTQFFGVAARLVRQVLVDAARARLAAKRGGSARRITLGALDGPAAASGHPASPRHPAQEVDGGVDLLALDDALERLAALDPVPARVVELRYFTGLSIEETARALGVSPATVKREWTVARAWLRRELAP